jgi:predicted Zn-dependent protease
LDPRAIAARHNRAVLRRALGDYAGAIADYDAVIAHGKLAALALRNRALVKRDMGDLSGAVADAQAAIKAQPRSAAGYKILGGLWFHLNEADKALGAFDRALAITADDAWALISRAEAQWMLGDRAAALSSLERAVAVDPANWAAWGHRAALRMEQGDAATARAELDRAVELEPDAGVRRIQRGVIYHAQKRDLRRALADLREGVQRSYGEMRTRGRILALALALRLGDGVARQRLLGELRTEGPSGWRVRLARVAAGSEPLAALQADARHDPERRCDAALVAGLRAELDGDLAAGRAAYAQAADARRPAHLCCLLARALAAEPVRAADGARISE